MILLSLTFILVPICYAMMPSVHLPSPPDLKDLEALFGIQQFFANQKMHLRNLRKRILNQESDDENSPRAIHDEQMRKSQLENREEDLKIIFSDRSNFVKSSKAVLPFPRSPRKENPPNIEDLWRSFSSEETVMMIKSACHIELKIHIFSTEMSSFPICGSLIAGFTEFATQNFEMQSFLSTSAADLLWREAYPIMFSDYYDQMLEDDQTTRKRSMSEDNQLQKVLEKNAQTLVDEHDVRAMEEKLSSASLTIKAAMRTYLSWKLTSCESAKSLRSHVLKHVASIRQIRTILKPIVNDLIFLSKKIQPVSISFITLVKFVKGAMKLMNTNTPTKDLFYNQVPRFPLEYPQLIIQELNHWLMVLTADGVGADDLTERLEQSLTQTLIGSDGSLLLLDATSLQLSTLTGELPPSTSAQLREKAMKRRNFIKFLYALKIATFYLDVTDQINGAAGYAVTTFSAVTSHILRSGTTT